MTRRLLEGRRRVIAVLAVAGALTLGLSGCVSAEETSSELRGSVVQIAERAAAGDYVGALAALALLDRDINAAVDAGHLDAEREQEIRTAMELVRADLEAAEVATSPTPEPEPEPEQDPAPDDANEDNGSNEDDNDGPGNSGNKGKGNNNGNKDDDD
jgi:hypothetical protein